MAAASPSESGRACRRRARANCQDAAGRVKVKVPTMSVWEAITWDVARAGGFTAYILLTLAVALGLALTLQIQSSRWPRLINSELHNYLTLLSLVFVGVHVLAVWVDPFTRFG